MTSLFRSTSNYGDLPFYSTLFSFLRSLCFSLSFSLHYSPSSYSLFGISPTQLRTLVYPRIHSYFPSFVSFLYSKNCCECGSEIRVSAARAADYYLLYFRYEFPFSHFNYLYTRYPPQFIIILYYTFIIHCTKVPS